MDFQITAEFKNQADKYTVQNLIETQIFKHNFRKKYRENK